MVLCGLYNARNAAIAALTAGIALNANSPTQMDLTCLKRFQGVKRRQEKLFQNKHYLIFEDFAHHPTAIKETLSSFRAQYSEHQIIACFEPRSNTAQTQLFQSEFTDALSVADQVLLGALVDKRSAKVRKVHRLLRTELDQQRWHWIYRSGGSHFSSKKIMIY